MNNFYKTFKFKLLKPLVLIVFLLALMSKVNAQSSGSPFCYGDPITLFSAPAVAVDAFNQLYDFGHNDSTAYFSWSKLSSFGFVTVVLSLQFV